MRNLKRKTLAGLISLIGTVAASGGHLDPARFELVLAPIVISYDTLRTANGAVWRAPLFVNNGGTSGARFVFGETHCGPIPVECDYDPATVIPPGATWWHFGLSSFLHRQNLGRILFIERDKAASYRFSSRLVDEASDRRTPGVELPIVREKDFFTSAAGILDVPVDARSRVTLRIYDPDVRLRPASEYRVDIFTMNTPVRGETTSARLLATRTIGTTRPEDDFEFPTFPLYAEIPDIAVLGAEIVHARFIRIEVTPLTTGSRFYTFVSVMDREEPSVTVITPQ